LGDSDLGMANRKVMVTHGDPWWPMLTIAHPTGSHTAGERERPEMSNISNFRPDKLLLLTYTHIYWLYLGTSKNI
jgi:hypothetical protein